MSGAILGASGGPRSDIRAVKSVEWSGGSADPFKRSDPLNFSN